MSLLCKLRSHYDPHRRVRGGVCAVHVTKGVYGFDQLAADISHHCSLTQADVVGCMEAMLTFTRERILAGYVVEYRGLGRFCLMVDSTLTSAEETVRPDFSLSSIIRGVRLRFIPTISFRRLVATSVDIETIPDTLPATAEDVDVS